MNRVRDPIVLLNLLMQIKQLTVTILCEDFL